LQAVFKELGLSKITDLEVEAATYAHGSKDMPDRNELEDFEAIEDLMNRGLTGIDIVKALMKTNYEDVADSILSMLKQRISGDYLQTSAILDDQFNVNSAVNNANDYQGPGTGYRVQGERWEEIKNIPNIINPDDI
jgi:propanediol dehydratase large subunit